jgi:hypothetical protein
MQEKETYPLSVVFILFLCGLIIGIVGYKTYSSSADFSIRPITVDFSREYCTVKFKYTREALEYKEDMPQILGRILVHHKLIIPYDWRNDHMSYKQERQ